MFNISKKISYLLMIIIVMFTSINVTLATTTGTVTVDTYSGGTYIGHSSYVFTLGVPASVVPSVSSITAARIDNSVPSTWGIYVQNRSGVV